VQPDAGQAEFVDGGFLTATAEFAGLRCQGACLAWYSDNQNCGGCGVTCCPANNCSIYGPAGFRGFVDIGGWCI